MIDTQLAPLVAGIWAEVASALVIILIGVWAETSGVNKKSVGANILGLFLMLVTAGLDLAVLPLLMMYLMFGVGIYCKRWKQLYFFFSSKTYGCLMLGIALLHTSTTQNFVQPAANPLLTNYVSVASIVGLSSCLVVAYWFAAIPFAYLLSYLYKSRR